MNELLRGLDAEVFQGEGTARAKPRRYETTQHICSWCIYLIKQGVRAVDTGGRQGLDPKGPCDISHSKGWGRS